MTMFDSLPQMARHSAGRAAAESLPLLGLALFESDPDVIDVATEQRVAYLRQCATGEHVAESQKLLNEVAAARLCLVNAERKRAYDAQLRGDQEPARESSDRGSRESSTRTVASSAAPALLAFATKRPRAMFVAGTLLLVTVALLWAGSWTSPKSYVGTTAGQERDDNGLSMKFCWCPPDSFTMGSPLSEPYRVPDEDQVPVSLTQGFWLGKFEVTQDEWRQVMGTTIREQYDKRPISSIDMSGDGARQPMYFVSHDEAIEFCRKLTEQERRERRLPQNWEYRLPTEARWEYACRAGSTTATVFGNSLSSTQANFDGRKPYNGGVFGTSLGRTIDVGSYKPNAWGLCDMHGNVWEWCADYYSRTLPGGRDPAVLTGADSSDRVIRGGGWISSGERCRSEFRLSETPSYRFSYISFRVAVVPTGSLAVSPQ